ncbi:TraB/GumN family protein [Methylobacillus arboreus]|nr:TraB/GumN family protein [Methylobacillus arboreus]
MLWKIQLDDGPASYLFGTIHVDDSRVTTLVESVNAALDSAAFFMMEVLPSSDVSPYFMQETSLDKLLDQQELEKVFELADFHGIERGMVLRMKPWLLAMVFDLPISQSPYTMDVQLYLQAQRAGKGVKALESVQAHFSALESISLDEQLLMLRSVLARTQQQKETDFELLIQAYLAGDLERVGALDEQMTGDDLPKALWDKLRVQLLDARNVQMAESIAAEARQQSVFVAVGAAHLPGEQGLIARLRQSGFTVSLVE